MWLKSLPWLVTTLIIAVPIVIAASSPLLQWRDPLYIMAGMAGVIALALLLVQPLLVGGYLPGLSGLRGRQVHRMVGCLLLLSVVVHVVGLWITSPPDVIDALLFRSPTPFSVWGVIAMWGVFAAAISALLRRRLQLKPNVWRFVHASLAMIIVAGTIIHALQIEGTMGTISKVMLSVLTAVATCQVLVELKSLRLLQRKSNG